MLVAVLVIGAVWAAVSAVHVFLLVLMGILLAILFRTVGRAITHYTGIPINWSMAVVIGASLLGLFGLAWQFGAKVAEQTDMLLWQVSQAYASFQQHYQQYRGLHQFFDGSPNLNLEQYATRAASGALWMSSSVVLVLFVGIYVSIKPALYVDAFLSLFKGRRRLEVRNILDYTGTALRWWLLGQLIAMAVVGVITGVGLVLLQLPMAIPLSVVAALFTFVPYVGALVSAIPAILIGFSINGETAMYVVLVFFIAHIAEGYVVVPLIQHRFVHLPPALTLAAQFVMEVLVGVIGITMAPALLVIAEVLMKRLYFHEDSEEGDRKVA